MTIMAELLYIVASLHIILCPFTKVEESFNIQAAHDILYHRHNLSLYDHNEFPGVVPRTFIGPLFVAVASAPATGLLFLCGVSKFWTQYVVWASSMSIVQVLIVGCFQASVLGYGININNKCITHFLLKTMSNVHVRPVPIYDRNDTIEVVDHYVYLVRFTLALLIIGAWSRLRNTLKKQFGNAYQWWFTILTVTQYHFMFYLSRPLPNIMAMPLVLLAYDGWLSGRQKQFLITAGAAIIIFRSELALLFGLFLIIDVYFKKIELIKLLKIIVPTGIGIITLTVIVDSIFWGRLVWPEAEVFWFNTILNKSANWGTSPFLWYFYSALPRGLGPSLLLIPLGIFFDRRVISFAAPALVYIFFFSFLPHKELRFIIYVFPLLNMVSASACSYIFIRRTKTPVYELLFWGIVVLLVGNVIFSLAFVSVARTNYPGGVAINRFHRLLKDEPFIHLHIDNLAAQTGVTRFTQINNHWLYSKNESLEPNQLQEFTHLLMEAKSKYSPNLKSFSNTHMILESIESFTQITFNYKLIPPLKIKTKPAIFILQRKDFREFPYGHIVNSIETEESIIEIPKDVTTDSIDSNFDLTDSSETEEPEWISSEIEELENNTLSNEEAARANSENIIVDVEQALLNNEVINLEIDNEVINLEIDNEVINLEIDNEVTHIELDNAKKAFDDMKILKQERKQRVIDKIKSETRQEVVASAKEKLKEIMKRHQHVAEKLSENIVIQSETELNDDLADEIHDDLAEEIHDDVVLNVIDSSLAQTEDVTQTLDENVNETNGTVNNMDKNINAIVEEVIVRLIDRKIYNDKTKPEDIKSEDRYLIQQIVEEVVSEKMNFSNSHST